MWGVQFVHKRIVSYFLVIESGYLLQNWYNYIPVYWRTRNLWDRYTNKFRSLEHIVHKHNNKGKGTNIHIYGLIEEEVGCASVGSGEENPR